MIRNSSFKWQSSGQALAETSLVLPLFLFILLGILQMSLVYQANYLLKYAAYRAARTGALQSACNQTMHDSALAVLAPILGVGYPLNGRASSELGDGYMDVSDKNAASYAQAIARAKVLIGPLGVPLIQVVICGPTEHHLQGAAKNDNEIDFDDPRNLLWKKGSLDQNTLREFERTKLRVQVQYAHQLVVPFANWIIFNSWAGMNLIRELRMQRTYAPFPNVPGSVHSAVLIGDQGYGHRRKAEYLPALAAHAKAAKRYFLPLHANYAFRMQSNLYPDSEDCALPEDNRCWHYDDGEEGKPAAPSRLRYRYHCGPEKAVSLSLPQSVEVKPQLL